MTSSEFWYKMNGILNEIKMTWGNPECTYSISDNLRTTYTNLRDFANDICQALQLMDSSPRQLNILWAELQDFLANTRQKIVNSDIEDGFGFAQYKIDQWFDKKTNQIKKES